MEEKSLKEEWAATKSQEGGTSWWSSVAEGLNWIPGKGTRSQRPQLTDPACRKEERRSQVPPLTPGAGQLEINEHERTGSWVMGEMLPKICLKL